MKHSKSFKIIIAILIAITLFLAFSQNSFALSYNIDNKFRGTQDQGNATNTVAILLGKVINFIQVIGMGIAIIMLIVIGIRWMGSSPSGKVQLSKTLRYYIAGAIFIFAAVGLLEIVKNFTKGSVNNV